MLMTKLKSEEVIGSLTSGKVFIINCHGCKEVGFPEADAKALQDKLQAEGKVVGVLTTDYVCNPDELALRLRGPMGKIAEADVSDRCQAVHRKTLCWCSPAAWACRPSPRFWRISRCMPAATPSSCPASRA